MVVRERDAGPRRQSRMLRRAYRGGFETRPYKNGAPLMRATGIRTEENMRCVYAVLSALLLLLPAAASAQGFQKPIRIIVPFAPGASADGIARAIATTSRRAAASRS